MSGENRNGRIELDFADGTYGFRLAIGELEELQEKTAVGPYVLLQRLASGAWSASDVRETIRIGLIGGGADPIIALNLVRRYVDQATSWLRNATVAQAIVSVALSGAPEEEPGKGDSPGAEMEAQNSQTDALLSANYTELPAP